MQDVLWIIKEYANASCFVDFRVFLSAGGWSVNEDLFDQYKRGVPLGDCTSTMLETRNGRSFLA